MNTAKKDTLLKVDKLEVVYHNVSTAVQGVSLEVKNNQIVALLGVNGAGKTTTLRAISGFLGVDDAKVTEGFIELSGEKLQNLSPDLITKKGVVLVPERDKVFEHLTVEENLLSRLCECLKLRLLGASLYLFFPGINIWLKKIKKSTFFFNFALRDEIM